MIISFEIKGHECLIDHDDVDLLTVGWTVAKSHGNFYARKYSTDRNKRFIHRRIMGAILGRELEAGEIVDHIDRNGLNNTRSNLRLATQTQNLANAKVRKHNKLGVKGVFWDKWKNKYKAKITVNKKVIQLGRFNTVEEAHAAYVAAAIKYYGDFASGG